MKWILIMWFVTYSSPAAITPVPIEFNTEEACKEAGASISKKADETQVLGRANLPLIWKCVAKGREVVQ